MDALPTIRLPTRRAMSRAVGLVALVAATPARAAWSDWAEANPLNDDGPAFLMVYVASMILVAMLVWVLRDVARTSDRRPDLRDLGDVALAYCIGGDGRAADTLYVALAVRGAASLDINGIVVTGIVPQKLEAALPPDLETYRRALVGIRPRARYLAAFADSSPYRAMKHDLLARRILLDAGRRARLERATWIPAGLLVAFGCAKVGVGLARGMPVGVLVLLVAATAIAAVVVLRRERYLTREARASLESLRGRSGRAMRAPRPEELPFAVAMVGVVALNGTVHAGYARRLAAPLGSSRFRAGSGKRDGGGCIN